MYHQIFKRPVSNRPSFILRLARLAERFLRDSQSRLIRQFRFEDAEGVEGQSRSFRVWMFSSFGALICILLLNLHASSDESSAAAPTLKPHDLISQIPQGHVLVPIEPMNLEAIDAVFGDHGWADLFVEREDLDTAFRSASRMARRRIAVGVPLVRAPRNPSRLAVIVPEVETQLISSLGQPVHVALRRSPPKRSLFNNVSKVRKNYSKQIRTELVHEDGIEDSI